MKKKGNPELFGEDGQLDIMKIKPLVSPPSHKGYHGPDPKTFAGQITKVEYPE